MTNAHNEMGQIAVCCQNLMLGALSSISALSILVWRAIYKVRLLFEHASYRGCVGPRAGLDGCGNPRPLWYSISGPFSP